MKPRTRRVPAPAAPAPAGSDGRRQRSADSRRRIVAAMIDLVRAGNLTPSAEAVSRQADVSLRTVFRHFDDMDSLYREMSAAIEADVLPIASAPLPAGPWPELLTELIARRARLFERVMPFKLAGGLRRHQSELLERQHRALNAHLRRVLQGVAPASVQADAARFEALDLLLSFDSWHRLRDGQGLGPARAQAVLRAACLAITEPGADRNP